MIGRKRLQLMTTYARDTKQQRNELKTDVCDVSQWWESLTCYYSRILEEEEEKEEYDMPTPLFLFSTFDTIVMMSSLQVYLKRQFFNINICCFIIAVCIIFIRKTLRRPANQLWSYDCFSMSKMSAGRHLGFSETVNFTIRSAVPDVDRLSGSGGTVVTMTSKVNGTMEILTPVDLKPLKILKPKLEWLCHGSL